MKHLEVCTHSYGNMYCKTRELCESTKWQTDLVQLQEGSCCYLFCFYPLQCVALRALCCTLAYMNCKCHQLTYFRLHCKMRVKPRHHFCVLKWLPTMLKELWVDASLDLTASCFSFPLLILQTSPVFTPVSIQTLISSDCNMLLHLYSVSSCLWDVSLTYLKLLFAIIMPFSLCINHFEAIPYPQWGTGLEAAHVAGIFSNSLIQEQMSVK